MAENISIENTDAKAGFFDELMKDKSIRRTMLRQLKTSHPDAYLPELEAEDIVNERTAGLEKTVQELRLETERKELERKLFVQKQDALKKFNLNASDMEAVEKMMAEKGIANYETGAEHFVFERQAATPTPSVFESRKMQMPDVKDWRDYRSKAKEEMLKALHDLKTRNVD